MNSSREVHSGHHFRGTHYVVSEDIDILLGRWCSQRNLKSPPRALYRELRLRMQDFLRGLFARVTMIPSAEIRAGLLDSVARHKANGLTVVSAERAYLEDTEVDGRIELTRIVDTSRNDIGIASRAGKPLLAKQIDALHGKDIALIDDVVFTGGTLAGLSNDMRHSNATVHAITAAIGVKNGIAELKKLTYTERGTLRRVAVDCVEEFEDVSDQVCERDFYPGVPHSGRQLNSENISFPYVLPFGRLDAWASIPEKELRRFSLLCLENTIKLFTTIEKINGISISCENVPRLVHGLPSDKTNFAAAILNAIRQARLA